MADLLLDVKQVAFLNELFTTIIISYDRIYYKVTYVYITTEFARSVIRSGKMPARQVLS